MPHRSNITIKKVLCCYTKSSGISMAYLALQLNGFKIPRTPDAGTVCR